MYKLSGVTKNYAKGRIGVMNNGRLKFGQSAGTQQAQAEAAWTQPVADESPAG
jgi:hypothetical protein